MRRRIEKRRMRVREPRIEPQRQSNRSVEPAQEQSSEEPHWLPELHRDLDFVLEQRVSAMERRGADAAAIAAQRERNATVCEQQPVEMQLSIVMNNFSHYLPVDPITEDSLRAQIDSFEEDAKEDPKLAAMIESRKRLFAAVDEAIAERGISSADIELMRDAVSLDKKSDDYKRAMRLLGDLFFDLRAQGFSIAELI